MRAPPGTTRWISPPTPSSPAAAPRWPWSQLDDLAGNLDQVNLPGTVDQYPNWRRKVAMSLEQIADDVRACALMSLMSAAR